MERYARSSGGSWLAKYGELHPGTNIIIITDTITNLYEKLRSYEIEIAFAEGRSRDATLNSALLDTDSLILSASVHSRLANKSMVTLSELKHEKLILRLPDSGTRNLFVSHLESNGLSMDDFNVILEVDNIATIKDLVRQDFGVSILAKSAFLDELRKGKMVGLPVENLSMIREVSLVYQKDFQNPDLLREMTRLYSEVVKQE